MRIQVVLEVDDDALIDRKHRMGITNEAYEDLVHAVSSAGFSIQDIEKI